MSERSDLSDPLCLVFIPALVAILHMLEKRKGAPLTESEVLETRDKAVCMSMPASVAAQIEEKRGYSDIVAEDAWNEWQRAGHFYVMPHEARRDASQMLARGVSQLYTGPPEVTTETGSMDLVHIGEVPA